MQEEDYNKKLNKKEKEGKQVDIETKRQKNSNSNNKGRYNSEKSDLGEIEIAPEVLATIVSRIVIDIPGVAGFVSHSKSGLGTLLGAKEMEEGIKVDLADEKHMAAYISIIIKYGYVIIDVAKKIQFVVKEEIESNTGLVVKNIDVNIMGIQLSKKNIKSTH